MKFFFRTLGCKMNFLDSARVSAALQSAGHHLVESEEEADTVFVNSCTVTARADRQSRQEATKAGRAQKTVAVFGCSTRIKAQEWREKYPDFLIFKDEYEILTHYGIEKEELDFPLQERTRIPIAIQTGCDNFCTFCITRIARGKAQDFSLESIMRQVKRAEDAGIQEIVLTGIQLASWGCDDSLNTPLSSKLPDLLQKIIDETTIPRIRMSSLGPQFLGDRFFEILKNPRICDHLHLSIQSGSETILKKMNRGHSTQDVYNIAKRAKEIRPNIALSTDFIVGFPTEGDKEFEETITMVKEIGFAKLHVFPFSPREGTGAANFPQVDEQVKKSRAKRLREVGLALQKDFYKRFEGQIMSVLCEIDETGLTTNYLRVKCKSKHNQIMNVKLTSENIVYHDEE